MRDYKLIKWNSLINIIIFLLLGLLLLIFPIESLSIGGYLIASILMLGGLSHIVKIISNKGIKTNGDALYLILSIIIIGVSISMFIDPTWIIRLINIFVGLILIISGIFNAIGIIDIKNRNAIWWIYLSISIIVLILGVIVIINPIKLASIITRLEGASLICDAIITFIISRKLKKII